MADQDARDAAASSAAPGTGAAQGMNPGAGPRLVLVEHPAPGASPLDGVALVTLDRPEVLNALSYDLLEQLADALEALDADPGCRAIVLTGAGDRAFVAGVDIKELARETSGTLEAHGRFGAWDRIWAIGTPLIAAVRGFCLGGGWELAMSCDLVVAGEDAQFGQPELRIGVIPGAGGTQRLTRTIGKARAMDLILTGRRIPAAEAETMGLVSRVVPTEQAVEAALEVAGTIAAMPPLAVRAAVAAVRQAQELSLAAGLAHERRAFYALFDTEDKAEGMAAFLEKRQPTWRGQ
jgi:enoyl-CoA hydratase